MSQRTQWIILGVLLGLLAIVAVVTLRSREQSGAAASPPPETGAPGGAAQAAPSPENSFVDAAKLNTLREWFNEKSIPSRSEKSPAVTRSFRAQPRGGEPAKGAGPPNLQGTLWVNGVAMALFEGEAFATNEKIRGTAYTVTTVEPESVSVTGADGKVTTLKLSE